MRGSGCSEEKIIILTLNFYKSRRRMKGVIFLIPLLWHASKGGVCYLELTLVARSGSEDLGGSIFYLLRYKFMITFHHSYPSYQNT